MNRHCIVSRLLALLMITAVPLLADAQTPSTKPLPFTGTNLSGGEFGNVRPDTPPIYDKTFTFPTEKEFDYFATRGMNIFRIPFHWETLQPTLKSPLVPAELTRLKDVVTLGTKKGLTIIIDPHNYARHYGKVIGGPEVSDADFADLWTQLAETFRNDPHVWFGLMNEPHDMPTADWLKAANAAIAAIRKTGAKNQIVVPGNGWSGAHSWVASGNDLLLQIKDPADRYLFEAHQYLDSDNSGSHPEVVSPTIGSERLRSFTEWCRQHHKRALLGEFGVAASETGRAAIEDMLTFMEKNADVWVGFTWWSAGPWWGDYMFSIEPANGMDKPQMTYLAPHLQGKPSQP